jgi:hypothetical protein
LPGQPLIVRLCCGRIRQGVQKLGVLPQPQPNIGPIQLDGHPLLMQ